MARKAEKVLDAGALLNSNFFVFENAVLPPSVADEVKSKGDILQALLESGAVKIGNPSERSINAVKGVARRMGETNALSKADIDALALALEVGATIVTDDFHVQNVAEEMGISFQHVTERIKERRVWKRRCLNCKKGFPQAHRGKRCPVCGGKIIYSSN